MVDDLTPYIERLNRDADKYLSKVTRKLRKCVEKLEIMGENDMGSLNYTLARRFHAATADLRALLTDLEK